MKIPVWIIQVDVYDRPNVLHTYIVLYNVCLKQKHNTHIRYYNKFYLFITDSFCDEMNNLNMHVA